MRWASAAFLLLMAIGGGLIAATHLFRSQIVHPSLPPPEQAPYVPPPPVGAQWRYTSPQATPAAAPGAEACTKSRADVPIGGGALSIANLCLRRGGGYPYSGSVTLVDQHGQIVCSGCAVQVRFDAGAAQSLDGTASSPDGTKNTVFFADGPQLAADLKHATTATFTFNVHGAGEQQATFDVAGLRWDR